MKKIRAIVILGISEKTGIDDLRLINKILIANKFDLVETIKVLLLRKRNDKKV